MERLACPHCNQPLPAPLDSPRCAYAPCGAPFERLDHKQIYCKDNCRLRAHREAKRAKSRPCSSAPRVLEQRERITRVEARIPAGTEPKDVPPEERTLDMFADPAPEVRPKVGDSAALYAGLSVPNPRQVDFATRIRWLQEDILSALQTRRTMTYREMMDLGDTPAWRDFKSTVFLAWLGAAEDVLRQTGRIVWDSTRDSYALTNRSKRAASSSRSANASR